MAMRAGLLSSILAVSLLVAVAAAADPKEAHKLGVEAVESGRWADAERFFRAALAERPEEKVNRLLKTAYLPHYYLGVALSEMGNCKAAIDSWAVSDRQGQIQKSKYSEDLSQRRQRCQNHLRQVAAARTEVEQLLAQVDETSSSLASLSRTAELAPGWTADGFASRLQLADKKLVDARRRLEETTASVTGNVLERLDGAKTLAMQAQTELAAIRGDARRRLGELNAAAAAALEELETAEQSARRALRQVSDLAPYPKRLGSRVAAVDRVLKEIRDAKSEASAKQLEELNGTLTSAVSSLRRAARRPPAKLAQAAEAFLGGSFQQALELLEDEDLAGNPRSKPHVCLLRAASGHALWVLSGERDESLLELATAAVTACADSEPQAEPDTPSPSLKYFSPRFVEFRAATLEAIARATEEAKPPEGETESPAGELPAEIPPADVAPTEDAATNGR